MHKLIAALAAVSFFLAFLTIVLKHKRGYFKYYPQVWKALVLGGIFFLLAVGTNLVSTLYPTDDILASDWRQVIPAAEMLGCLVGGALVLVGFLKWCGSLMEGKNNAVQRLRQLSSLRSILSITNHRGELDEILKEALSVVTKMRGYRMGLMFKRTFNSSEMTLVAHQGVAAENLFTLFDLCSKNPCCQETLKSQEISTTTDVRSLPECESLFQDREGIGSFACVPVKFRGKIFGLMGIYDSKPDRFSYQEIQFLTSVGDTLGLAAKQIYTCKRNKKRRDYISAVENVLEIRPDGTTLEDAFPKISAELGRIIDFDHISIDLRAGDRQDVRRISIGTSGGMLVDKKAVISSIGNDSSTGTKQSEVRLDRDLELGDDQMGDPLVRACGIRSRMLLPLGEGDSVYGVLCLGHKKPDFYSPGDAKWLKLFALGLCHLIREQRLKEESKKKEILSRSLYESERKLAREEDLKKFLHDSAARLTLDLPKSFARVMLLSRQGDELLNCAASQIRSEGINLRGEERFSLNDLPWHRLTLEAKRPMLINQDDPESVMSKNEARLVMDERLNSALLVPLMMNDEPVGILSVGEMRNWSRQPLTPDETEFIKHKANQLCLALKKGILRRSNERLKEKLKDSGKLERPGQSQIVRESGLSDLSYRISNPLTIIRGAAELLKLTETELGPDSLRYIRNIENGVDRIHASLKEYLNAVSQSKQSNSVRRLEETVST